MLLLDVTPDRAFSRQRAGPNVLLACSVGFLVAGRIGIIAAGRAVGIGARRGGTQRGSSDRSGANRSCTRRARDTSRRAQHEGRCQTPAAPDAADADRASPNKATAGAEASHSTGAETTGVEASEGEAIDEKCRRSVATGSNHLRARRHRRSTDRLQACAFFSITTASLIFDPSLLKTDTVAFGGSLAKLSSLGCPATIPRASLS